jgi:hypothetical protein
MQPNEPSGNKGVRKKGEGNHLPRAVVGLDVTSIDDGISKRLVRIVDADLGANAPPQTLFCSLSHLGETSEVLFR